MGFRPKNKVYRLIWAEDHDLHGFEVQARAMRLGEMLSMVSVVAAAKDEVGDFEGLVDQFAKVLVSWNWEDEGGDPVPATAEGLRTLETPDFFALLDAYINAGVGVSGPLPNGSPSGRPSPAELPPMDEL